MNLPFSKTRITKPGIGSNFTLPGLFPILLLMAAIFMTSCSGRGPELTLAEDEQAYTILADHQPLLSYVYSETPAPEGTDPLYKRSGYIHPLYSPGGMRLTRIQPPDHYHHYGIWGPWTHTHFGPYKVDFWNLALGQGTVRFSEKLGSFAEDGAAGIQVRQEHIYFKVDSLEAAVGTEAEKDAEANEAGADDGEGLAMEEFLEITVHDVDENRYMVDYVSNIRNVLDTELTLEAYRYGGGIGFRGTEAWGPGNASVLTSEGKTWENADATHARWVIVEGESQVPEGRSGILFMSHPLNRAHPEPMRMWPPDGNQGKENIFFEFCPIRHQEWVLEPWLDYRLQYRMVVFDGTLSLEEAEGYWEEFATSAENE